MGLVAVLGRKGFCLQAQLAQMSPEQQQQFMMIILQMLMGGQGGQGGGNPLADLMGGGAPQGMPPGMPQGMPPELMK